jgi:ssDNA-binding Zn-finger/Zn-ribbon topoisomerase 1
MTKNNIETKANINLEVNCPCPKCHKGHLIPFVNAKYKNEATYDERELDHYEIYYRCSRSPVCSYGIEG